jgi:hypothetical protein
MIPADRTILRVVNPLPHTLFHYQTEFEQTLERIGISSSTLNSAIVEGLTGPKGRLAMLWNAMTNARAGASSSESAIQLWPSLGLLEPLLWQRIGARKPDMIIYHDPVPLRPQVGFGGIARLLARRLSKSRSPVVISHSLDASEQARKIFPTLDHRLAYHPILTKRQSAQSHKTEVVVAGQYKPERDLDFLGRIGRHLRERGFDPVIYGRGWPPVGGWRLVDNFLTELELDAAIDRAAFLIIPYKAYFQSGIAVRGLERGVISLGPRNSFSESLYGVDAPFLYNTEESVDHTMMRVEAALEHRHAASVYFDSYQSAVDESWRRLLY